MSSSDCIFCKIASKDLPSELVYEDKHVVAFSDTTPQAPKHVLVIPREHVESIMELSDKELAAHILVDVIPHIATNLGLAEKGFRVVTNVGEQGGQTVKHLHFHVLGGRDMQWPPG